MTKTEREFSNSEWNPQLVNSAHPTGQISPRGPFPLTLIGLVVEKRRNTISKGRKLRHLSQPPGGDRLTRVFKTPLSTPHFPTALCSRTGSTPEDRERGTARWTTGQVAASINDPDPTPLLITS